MSGDAAAAGGARAAAPPAASGEGDLTPAVDEGELETSALVVGAAAAAEASGGKSGGAAASGGAPSAAAPAPGAPRWATAQAACLLALVAVIWVGASELVSELAALHAGAPWTMTYLNVSEFALLLPVRAALDAGWRWRPRRGGGAPPPAAARARTDWRAAAAAAAPLAPVWFLAQATFNAALSSGASVASATTLSSTSTFFTLALGLALGDRPPAARLRRRAAGAALIVAGAALVGAADARDGGDGGGGGGDGGGGGGAPQWRGDALALASACLYAVYTTLLSRLSAAAGVPDDALFGCVGALTAVTALPLVAGLAAGRAEDARPLLAAPALLAAVAVKGLLDNVASNLLWARAVRLSSPVLGTAGLALTIPLALAADAARGRPPAPLAAGGAALVGGGFLLAALGEAAA